MDQRKNEEEVPEILRNVYETASDAAEFSDLALTRTVRALRERDLLRSESGRRRQGRRTAGRLRGWNVAVLVGLAFLGGYLLGRGDSPTFVTPRGGTTTVADPGRTAELVQEAGTTYVLALESLANSLDEASATQLSTARAVLRSTTTAQAESLRRLLTTNESASTTLDDRAVVWF